MQYRLQAYCQPLYTLVRRKLGRDDRPSSHTKSRGVANLSLLTPPVCAAKCFAECYRQSGVYREGRELWRGVPRYFQDQWNILDALGLLCLLVGLIIRWVNCGSPWGPAFFALSAPFLVSRVLFFAQILPFQGPMIQASVLFLLSAARFTAGGILLNANNSHTIAAAGKHYSPFWLNTARNARPSNFKHTSCGPIGACVSCFRVAGGLCACVAVPSILEASVHLSVCVDAYQQG